MGVGKYMMSYYDICYEKNNFYFFFVIDRTLLSSARVLYHMIVINSKDTIPDSLSLTSKIKFRN